MNLDEPATFAMFAGRLPTQAHTVGWGHSLYNQPQHETKRSSSWFHMEPLPAQLALSCLCSDVPVVKM